MGNTKILIVDDELIMRESLAGWLERDGHEIATAPSGEEALEILKEARFDILLVDIKMEGISGLEVLKHVKENDPDVAVVMITASGCLRAIIPWVALRSAKTSSRYSSTLIPAALLIHLAVLSEMSGSADSSLSVAPLVASAVAFIRVLGDAFLALGMSQMG